MLLLLPASRRNGQPAVFPATHENIRVVGRTASTEAHPTTLFFDWSSVYIVAHITGPASIVLDEGVGKRNATAVPTLGNSYLITVDGTNPVRINTTATHTEYSIPNLGPGVSGVVRIEKVSEAREDAGGVVGFNGINAAALLPLPSHTMPTRRVECIGDSIMCGAHSERGAPHFPADCKNEHGGNRESSHLSWCPVLARALEADYQMECCSGNGLVYTDNPNSAFDCDWTAVPPACPVMPYKWQQRLMCATDGVFVKKAGVCNDLGGLQPLDTSTPPHAVIINLGQNDYGAGHTPTTSHWIAAYTSFLRNISSTYAKNGAGTARAACGGMDSKYCNDTQAAIRSMAAAGMNNVHYLDLTKAGAGAYANGTTEGCPGTPGSHPSYISHALMAKTAEPTVRKVMGWPEEPKKEPPHHDHAAPPSSSARALAPPSPPTLVNLFTELDARLPTGYYRGPSLVTTVKGTLLAFVLGALHRHDNSPTIIYLRRSVDYGATWSTAAPILLDPTNATHFTGAAIVDPATSAIHYLFQQDGPGAGGEATLGDKGDRLISCPGCMQHIISSHDDGVTWSKPALAALAPNQLPNATFGKALASGIALTAGPHAGRLVYSLRHDCGCNDLRTSFAIYSDDHGTTWKGGEGMLLLPQFGGGWTESQVAELSNGSVIMTSRNLFGASSGQGPRLFARSDDGGETWAANWSAGVDLPDPYCEASLLGAHGSRTNGSSGSINSGGSAAAQPILYFANPSNVKARGNFSVHRSTDGGRTWPASRVLYPGPAAYSDVSTTAGGNDLAFLFERDNYRYIAFGTAPFDFQ
eukprot:gene7398-18685_t